jgi:hypothetical protein
MHASVAVHPFTLYKGNEKEEFMRITSLVIVLVAATALAALGAGRDNRRGEAWSEESRRDN